MALDKKIWFNRDARLAVGDTKVYMLIFQLWYFFYTQKPSGEHVTLVTFCGSTLPVACFINLNKGEQIKARSTRCNKLWFIGNQLLLDQPRGLVVRASSYKSRGTGFESRLYRGDFPCEGRIPVVTTVWVVSRFSVKVETSSTRSQKSTNSDWTHERSPRWSGPHHVTEFTS